jgi:Zn-dependent M28 family amino/carboxypeptidase
VFDAKDRSAETKIPAIYLKYDAAKKHLADPSASFTLKLRTSLAAKTRTGHNVVGYIDNHAANTVVFGAHYDHLGYGEDGNSMIRTGEKNIHNGADDNASGTAALIELGRILKTGPKGNNYLFIAFSGEELGLFGSKYFVENPTIDISKVSYMINMDMVGRLNDSSKTLTIGGVGTSPAWEQKIIQQNFMLPRTSSEAQVPPLVIRIDSSGTGPSDHTSFYRKDIPVLFYFTGLHTDYHKPSDDEPKINYEGMRMIIVHIQNLVAYMDDKGKIAFTKTREAQTTTSTRFSVSLGVMPDYTYTGTGMRIDGVTPGRPAEKAGMLAGDIVLSIGGNEVNNMETYMQALGKFKKGDRTTVKYKRGEELKEATVEF